jgi:hypothetical protein
MLNNITMKPKIQVKTTIVDLIDYIPEPRDPNEPRIEIVQDLLGEI